MSTPSPGRQRAVLLVTIAVTLVLAAWRIDSVALGPDPDSDSYAHFAIARQILVEPHNHGVHWVWLPLFHYLELPLAAAGASMNAVRYINVALWAGVGLLLYFYLRSREDGDTSPETAALAAVLTGLCPIGMQMGTTAQPEPLFALTVLGFAFAFERRRFVPAALLLAASVMLRYEAWAVLAGTGALLGLRVLRQRRLRTEPGGWWPYLALALPAAAILAWGLVRMPIDGKLFGFIGDTRRFANDALKAKSALDQGWLSAAGDTLYYVYDVAQRSFGWAIVVMPLGVVRLVRRHPMLALSGGACLFFVTLSWLMRSSLGLDRHFVSVIPAYATAMALGVETLADWIVAGVRRLGALSSERARSVAQLAAGGVIAIAVLSVVTWKLDVWMGHWRGSIAGGYRDRRAVAQFLNGLPEGQLIFCDEATVELMTDLPRERFERRSIDRKDVRRKVGEVAEQQREVYVASWAGKLKPLSDRGTIVYRPPGAKEGSGLAVLRVTAAGAK